MSDFSHFDEQGKARMVDVAKKAPTLRKAIAEGRLRVGPEAAAMILAGASPKGDLFCTARLAGIMGAKRTSELIPLCHPIPIDWVDVTFEVESGGVVVVVKAEAHATGRTGVEMEALTAASCALLTLYDMLKSADKGMVMESVRLLRKEGGRSGVYEAKD